MSSGLTSLLYLAFLPWFGISTLVTHIQPNQFFQTIGKEPSHVVEPNEKRQHRCDAPPDDKQHGGSLNQN
jgi:hypothetical protein